MARGIWNEEEDLMTTAGDQKSIHKKNRRALERAHDIRKFEIDLYWRRAAYFWTLIGAAFVAFFVVQGIKDGSCDQKNKILPIVVANLGLVFSFSWYLVNRGSKFWQQNWETHVDRLEKEVTGPLYRYRVERKDQDCWLTGSSPYSVSKINQMTSLYVIFVWFCLLVWSFVPLVGLDKDPTRVTLGILILFTLFTLVVWEWFCRKAKTDLKQKGDYRFYMVKRTAEQICAKHKSGCKGSQTLR